LKGGVMLDDLFAALDVLNYSVMFEDHGGVRFGLAQSTTDGLLLELFLVPGDGSDTEHWRIECFGVRDFLLQSEFAANLRLVSEHPVLLPFMEETTDLRILSPSPNPAATIGALFECHQHLVGPWIPFERSFYFPGRLSSVLAAPSEDPFPPPFAEFREPRPLPPFATGPESLMEAYSLVLGGQGIPFTLSPSRGPMFWDGEKWHLPPGLPSARFPTMTWDSDNNPVVADNPVHALILEPETFTGLHGSSYVIAERFDAQKVLTDSWSGHRWTGIPHWSDT
jgi:hypothetical protein